MLEESVSHGNGQTSKQSLEKNPCNNKFVTSGLCEGVGCGKVLAIPSAERRVYGTLRCINEGTRTISASIQEYVLLLALILNP